MKFGLMCLFVLFSIEGSLGKKRLLHSILSRGKINRISASYSPGTCGLEVPQCDPTYKYRSYDGSCNNLKHPTWGVTNSAYLRLFEPNYSDGIHIPPVASDGTELPNTRFLVTSLLKEMDRPESVSLIVAQWGQIISHDFGAHVPKTGEPDCCADGVDPTVCFSIKVPEDDPFYSKYNITCLPFTRGETALTGDCSEDGFRTPIDGVSHILDASFVYGSDDASAQAIREFDGGRLTVRTLEDGRCFLPSGGSCFHSKICYLAGESRVNQNLQLAVLQTLFVREHNRIADQLQLLHPGWSDETIFQETRSIVVAEYLHITYNGWLPFIIPDGIMQEHNLKSGSRYHGYDSTIPNIALEVFTTPVYRIFHSGLQGVLALYNYMLEPEAYINITDYLNSPGILEESMKFDQLVLGLLTQPMQTIDEFYPMQLKTKLFHNDQPYGQDLTALDIQRGRDHGVPPYTDLFYACRGIEINDFDDLTGYWDDTAIAKIRTLYKSVYDIDSFIGINYERKLEGHRFNPVVECIISEQFYRWKYSDRFWYEIQDQPHSFTPGQLKEIKKASLSRFICDTSDNIVKITTNSWLPPSDDNPIIPCPAVPGIDLRQWS